MEGIDAVSERHSMQEQQPTLRGGVARPGRPACAQGQECGRDQLPTSTSQLTQAEHLSMEVRQALYRQRGQPTFSRPFCQGGLQEHQLQCLQIHRVLV